jgi:hypothetical protein
MKKILIIITYLSTIVMFSSNSHSEWTEIVESAIGKGTYYLDFDRISKRNGYVYYWYLNDALQSTNGVSSGEIYRKGDCKSFRYKLISYLPYKQPMGQGSPLFSNPKTIENAQWTKPNRNSVGERLLKNVCDFVN